MNLLLLLKKGDSPVSVQDHLRAAQNYRAATKIEVERGIDISKVEAYYNVACSFSLAKSRPMPLNAWRRWRFMNTGSMSVIADSDFVPVHADKRWLPGE